MYNIRSATPEEWPALAEIWEDTVSATHNFLSATDLAEIKTRLPEYLDKADTYVYEERGRLNGFIGLTGDNIAMLFVRERGRGIGARLLDFAVTERRAVRVDVN